MKVWILIVLVYSPLELLEPPHVVDRYQIEFNTKSACEKAAVDIEKRSPRTKARCYFSG